MQILRRRVIYARGGGGPYELYSVNADDTGSVVLANMISSEMYSGSF